MRSYRSELDGLRALAILMIVIHHARFELGEKTLFLGGYIGVDIFFVLSGYLIAQIVFEEIHETSNLNYLRFVVKRLRRLGPALWTCCLMSFLFAPFYLSKDTIAEFYASIISALFYVSNFFYLATGTEFRELSGALKPLHHSWSLGMEMQFYLTFPLILSFFIRKLKENTWIGLLACILFFGMIAQILERTNDLGMFYAPIPRHGEFYVGALVAALEFHHGKLSLLFSFAYNQIILCVGSIMVILPMFLFYPHMPYPAALTFLPIFGTAIIIAIANENDIFGRILSTPSLRLIGLMSYSLYLWHHVVISFGLNSTYDPSNWDRAKWIAISVILSFLTWIYIEDRLRISSFRKCDPSLSFQKW